MIALLRDETRHGGGRVMTHPLVEQDKDLVTVDEFFVLVPEGQKADLIDGVIYMASPDTLRNDQLAGFVKFLMQAFADTRNLGKVFGSRFAFQLSDIRAPEPDVAFVSNQRFHLVEEKKMVGGPDIAVEIVSRDSRLRDYVEKKQLYQEADTLEYWIIDPLQRRAEFHRLLDGRYVLVPLKQNRIFRSEAMEGFWLDVEWLFAEPLPTAYEKFREIVKA
jgi:Uma2 family endonuclease